MLKFNCLLVDALSESSSVWRNAAELDVFAISSQQTLFLQFVTQDRTEVVKRSIPVCLENSRVISLRIPSEQLRQELIVKTIDTDFYPDGGWWTDQHIGVLLCPPLGNRPSITFNVVVRFHQYILFDCSR